MAIQFLNTYEVFDEIQNRDAYKTQETTVSILLSKQS